MTSKRSLAPSPEDLAQIAASLRRAEADRCPVLPPSSTFTLSISDAYTIQRRNTQLRLNAGERIVGRKVGLTSAAMQQQLGVDQPDFGVLFEAMVLPSGSDVALSELVAPRIEAEFAFRIAESLSHEVDQQSVMDAVSHVMLALEIIDSRVSDWQIGIGDTIADNASSARVVVGPEVPATPALLASLPEIVLELQADGEPLTSGAGSAVMGHPLTAVVWLLNALAQQGDGLRSGDIVLAGAVHASVPLLPGRTLTATCSALPDVTVHIVD